MINIRALLTLGTKGTDKAKKEVSDVNKQLDQAADNAERMNRTLGKTKTPGDTKQYRTQRSISGTRGAEGRNFAGLAAAGEGGLSGSFVGAYASLAANIFAVTAAFQALSNAARVEQLTKGLELMGARGGVALTLTAKNLQSVTDNAISAADAMKATAQASSAGFSGDEIERLGKVARGASLALGRDMGDALDRLTKGAIKLEPELLDELGIMTRLDDAVKVYADANGKAVSALTQTERRQAFLNAVLEEGERKFGDINEQIATNPYDQLAASVKNSATELGKLANEVLGPIARFFAENPFALVIPGVFLLSKALQGLGITAAAASLNVEKAFDRAYRGGEGLKTKSKATQTIFEDVATQPGQIKSLKDLSLAFREAEAAHIAKNGALKAGDKLSLAFNKTMLMTSFTVRNAAIAVKGLGVAIATAAIPMLAITLAVAAITFAFAQALKAWDSFIGNTKEIKESKAKMKELAEQAKETSIQIQLMLEPGKGQAGNAFDAIANSAAAANAEIEKFMALRRMTEEAEESNVSTYAVSSGEISSARGIMSAGDQIATAFGNLFKKTNRDTNAAIVTGSEAVQAEITRLQLRLEIENVEKSAAKLMAENFALQQAELPIAERIKNLREADFEAVSKSNKETAKYAETFKGLQETAKNINKLGRDLFPKENENALRDLSEEYNDFYKVLKRTEDEVVTDVYARGIGEIFIAQKSGLQDTLVALSNQKGTSQEIIALQEEFNGLLKLSTNVDEKKAALKKAEALGDQEKIKAASEALLKAETDLGVAVLKSAELQRQLALYSKILGAAQDITKQSLFLNGLREKLKKLEGDNLKSALEYSKAIQNAQRVATGADITLPEEFSYAYQAKIADMELRNAREIAKIKKESIDLQMSLDIFTLNNQKRQLELETAITGTRPERAKRATATAIVFDDKGTLRSQDEVLRQLEQVTDIELANLVLKNFQLATTDEQVRLTKNLAVASGAGLGAEVDRLDAIGANATAQLDASLKQESINIRNLKNLDELLKAKSEVTKLDKEMLDSLIGQSEIYGNISSIFKLETLPALNIQSNILKNQIKLQQDLVDQEKDPAAKAEYQRKLDLLLLQGSAIASQTKAVYQQANAYLIANGIQEMGVITKEESLLVDQIALQNSEKALANLKEELSLEQKLRDVQLTTARQIAQAEATKRGGEVAPQLEREFAVTEASNILKNLEAEKESLVKEKALVVEKMELEKLVMEIRLQAARQELENAIADAPAGTNVSESQSALGKITKAEGLLNSMFGKEMDIVNKQFATRTTILDTQIQGQQAVLDSLPKSAQEVADRLVEGLRSSLSVGIGGIGLTGAAADFYSRESQGIVNSGMSKEDQEAALANIRSMSSEIQGQQILAEGLNGIYSNLTSGIESAFMAMIDGSKSAKQAFGEMAAAIIKDIAAMIIKMLVFKAIEMGLNFLMPGMGTGVSMGAKVGSGYTDMREFAAAGGIIPLATGGVMDRSLGVQGVIKQPTYLVGEGRYNEAVVPLPNGRSIPVQMHGGGSQNNNVAVNVNVSNSGQVQTETQGQDMGNLGQAIAVAVQKELMAQKMPGGILNRYGAS
jgi:hypothetical protein